VVHAINPTDPKDPNCILAVDMKDGRGGTARDQSNSGLDFKLNGPVAWIEESQIFAGWVQTPYVVRPSSLAYTPLFGHAAYLTPTTGVDLTITTTTMFDFSGNKPFMIAFIISDYSIGFAAAQVSIFNWSQGANSCGISLEVTGGANQTLNLIFPGSGSAGFFNFEYGRDTRPHMFGIWRDSSGHIDYYYDGKLVNRVTGAPNINTCAGGSEFAIGKSKVGASGEMGGIVGPFWVWNNIVDRGKALAFFQAWSEQYSY